jgi:hypothetical protein
LFYFLLVSRFFYSSFLKFNTEEINLADTFTWDWKKLYVLHLFGFGR